MFDAMFLLRLALLGVVCASVAAASGCATTMKPVRPTTPVSVDGPPLAGLRFDGEEIRIREPGVPVSPSRMWQREVANYAASSLNRALSTSDQAPAAVTTVTFDLAEPPAFALGPHRDMSITLSSTLPDGSVVRSKPVQGLLDTWPEAALTAGLVVGGVALDVVSLVGVLYFLTTPGVSAGAVLIGALALGLGINLAQSGAEQWTTVAQEARWSDLFADALRRHAADVRAGVGRGPPPSMTSPSGPPSPGTADPSDAGAPPPLLSGPPR
jgi:hypothetical protein